MSARALPAGGEDAVCVAAAGVVAADVVDAVAAALVSRLGLAVVRWPCAIDPTRAWDAARGQYSSIAMMRQAVALVPPGVLRLLVVTEADLFVPVLSFVFGHAQLEGPVAIMAMARLRQSFYGLPADRGRELGRARVESLHEIGHTFGLTHCLERTCAMSLATSVEHVDVKDDDYCTGCRALVNEALARSSAVEAPAAGLGGSR
jgi:archaemetzincin